jgi:hypothetical protein
MTTKPKQVKMWGGKWCYGCKRPIKDKPFAPKWMLGKTFCNKKCAELDFNRHRDGLVADISKILRFQS